MIATFLLVAAVAAPQTPQAAVLGFIRPSVSHVPAHLRIVVQTPRYAIVHFDDALIESTRGGGQILTKRFAFGWQPIDLSIDNKPFAMCTIRDHGVPDADFAKLRGPLSSSTKDCLKGADSDQQDTGSSSDVNAVRAEAIGVAEIIPFVRVIDGYAYMEWWGFGGGENFYKKTPHGWKKFLDGGGAANVGDLTDKGVPLAIAKALLKQ